MSIRQTVSRMLLLSLSMGAMLLVLPMPAFADSTRETPITCHVTGYHDLDGDRTADQLHLACDFLHAGSFRDSISVIDQNEDMIPAEDWHEAGDFIDDVWMFDYGNDGKIELLIDFQPFEDTIIAKLYDVPQGGDSVPYALHGADLELSSNALPCVTIVTKDGWWTHETQISYNLDITVDDYVFAVHEANKIEEFLKTDRNRDFLLRVRDTNGDGLADYDWRTVFFQTQPHFNFVRTHLTVNVGNNESPISPTFPWPYIGNYSFGYTIDYPYTKKPPPIQIDWASGQITHIGEFVSSRGNDQQWFLYSYEEVKPGQITNTNFESPFVWYDLAHDNDRRPELSVRFQHYWPNDPVLMLGRFPEPLNNIRYSWDQDNDGFWDYKLGLLGTYSFESIVTVDDLQMRMLPYEAVPNWVISRPWGVGIFVAADSLQAVGEGIYEWDAPDWLAEGYFAGRDNEIRPPANGEPITTANTDFRQILPGYRGEYQIDFNRQAYLYLSPVDQKLHLVGAEKGIWNIDDYARMYYNDLNQDTYFDQWRFTVQGYTHSQLNVAHDFLIYSSPDAIMLKRTTIPPNEFEMQPPTNHAEWQILKQRVPQNKAVLQQTDLKAMVQQFNGPEWTINGAQLRDFRLTSDGFRFILHLLPNFAAQPNGFFSLDRLDTRPYVVTYDGRFRVALLTPPDISIALEDTRLTELQAGSLQVTLQNHGLQDLSTATLELWMTPPQGQPMLGTTQTVALLAQTPITTSIEWWPPTPGTWMLTPKLHQPDGHVITFASTPVEVLPTRAATLGVIVRASTSPVTLPLVVLAMGSLAGIAALIFWQQRHRFFKTQGG